MGTHGLGKGEGTSEGRKTFGGGEVHICRAALAPTATSVCCHAQLGRPPTLLRGVSACGLAVGTPASSPSESRVPFEFALSTLTRTADACFQDIFSDQI